MAMNVRDASGRSVSLLNDEPFGIPHAHDAMPYRFAASSSSSSASSPSMPGLLRSDSYDSQMSADPVSPPTPICNYVRGGYGTVPAMATSPYDDYADGLLPHGSTNRPGSFSDHRSVSYDDDLADRSGKRYPCRFKDAHNCSKTFTTSGHASRHSKIHTAEKAVPCTYLGCTKKFTRADNMKQHLETHFKDKSRSPPSRPSLSPGDRRSTTSSSKSHYSRSPTSPESQMPSPGAVWPNFGTSDLPMIGNRPHAGRTLSALDTLAMAVAHAQ